MPSQLLFPLTLVPAGSPDFKKALEVRDGRIVSDEKVAERLRRVSPAARVDAACERYDAASAARRSGCGPASSAWCATGT